MQAVIIAGGKGRRLLPFTTTIPKPLFPIGEKPVLQLILEQLQKFDISDFMISVGYLGELIEAYFGNGSRFKCRIQYVREMNPLGTAGPISLLPEMSDDFIFMNGDILASVPFPKAIESHKRSSAIMTVCTYRKNVKSSLGIVKVDNNDNVRDYLEKPEETHLVSSGVYIFNPRVKSFVSPNERIDIPELVLRLIHDNQTVRSHLLDGYWFDLGTPEDLEAAIRFYENNNP